MVEQILNAKSALLAAIAVAGSVALNQMGGWTVALQTLLLFMAVDYVTGAVVAGVFKQSEKSTGGALSSKAGFKGLCKKVAVLLLVLVAAQLDRLLGVDYAHNTVILFFVGNEGLSILENLGLMGVPFPDFLKNALDVLRDKGNPGQEEEKQDEEK